MRYVVSYETKALRAVHFVDAPNEILALAAAELEVAQSSDRPRWCKEHGDQVVISLSEDANRSASPQ